MADLAHRLSREVRGQVLTDAVSRSLYATDASPYRVLPDAVLVAGEVDDISAAVGVCRELGVPITARGAGTSLTGQCVGPGLQLDTSRLRTIHFVDPERRLARVEPGVSWWQLNREAARHNLEFGPDPATRRVATMGGMVGSNSGGTHSIIYGAAVEHVAALEAVLPDGRRRRLSGGDDLSQTGLPEDVAAALAAVRADATPRLGPAFSTLARRGSGYQLEHLCSPRPHMGRFLAGSDGTLALFTALEVELSPVPAARVLAVLGYAEMREAIEAVPALVETGPCAVELVSRSLLDVARADPVHSAVTRSIPHEVGALLFVEYQGDTAEEALAGWSRMDRCAGSTLLNIRCTTEAEAARMWAVREAGVGALSAVASGPRLPQAFVEDTIVAVQRLPGYAAEFEALFEAHGVRTVWYGHASTGLLHVRPFLDLTQPADLDRLDSLMKGSIDLVRAWGGDMCGEHGDGLAHSYWNERLFGPELYASLRAIKAAFDPGNLLNPGKVVEGPSPLASLRYDPTYAPKELPARISFADQGGWVGAVERCYGAGVCRKRDSGTMCPPAAATGLESRSTRARANLLREVATGALPMSELAAPQAREVMETCVMCKACKTECPARVDMARLKVSWKDAVRREHGAPLLDHAVARLRPGLKLGARVPTLANMVLGLGLTRRLLRLAPGRRIPSHARRALDRDLPRGATGPLLFGDCFTVYQEPEVGIALRDLASAAGETLALTPGGCCGRTALSAGFIDMARATAARTAAALRKTEGPLLFAEPSCLSAVTDDWQHLIGDVSDIASRSMPAEDYLLRHSGKLRFEAGGKVVLHGHCHQKALWGMASTEAALALAPGTHVTTLDSGCCGMAGSFGYQAKQDELSRAMAQRVLLPAVNDAPADTEVVATGTSCRHQLRDLGNRGAVHPLVYLAGRLRSSP
ncbi:MAG: FAD-binding and (Fe-S)-binding domain-containing protein [Candidatus Dormibacteria bacterium]